MTDHLQDKLDHLPTQPGVYLHKDAEGTVLYVGKAKNLRSRVRSYFHKSRPQSGRIAILVKKIADVSVIVTDTEAEALILENNLIKKHQPRYNVNLKDDKTYPYICIKNERFPRVFPTRTVRQDGSTYFGPYTDVKTMRLMLDTIRSTFKLRTCSLKLNPEPIEAGTYDVCLQYHIDNCKGPCEGLQSEEDYNATIDRVERLLNGKTKGLVADLREQMEQLAADMEYEAAADMRDRINALKKFSRRQKIVSQDFDDRDLFALERDEENDVACTAMFKVREGKVIGRQHKYIKSVAEHEPGALLQSFVERYYAEANFFPDEVLLSHDLPAPEPLEELLRERKGRIVPVKRPQRGEKASLMRMVGANARLLVDEWKLQEYKRQQARIPHAVQALRDDLRMDKLPRRIECFDISHLGGTGTVASCVVFTDGTPRKSDYRTYKIRSAEGRPDDFKAMREVIQRRYRRIREENGPWPDLVVIDGGKGQLSSAVASLKATEAFDQVRVIGLAKRLEEVYRPGDSDPLFIAKDSAALQLLQRVRDEAHRFAVQYQRKRRKKTTLTNELETIKGIGPKTAQALIRHFGSVRRVREAAPAAVADLVGPAKAQKVTDYFSSSAAAPNQE